MAGKITQQAKDREAALIELAKMNAGISIPTSGKKRSRSASSRSSGGLSQDAFRLSDKELLLVTKCV
jgi:hypothetical protein